MRTQPLQQQLDQIGVTPPPSVLHVEDRDVQLEFREETPDALLVLVLAVVHHEDTMRPEQQLPGDTPGGEDRHSGGSDLVPRVLGVEVLRRLAPVYVGGADEQNMLRGCHRLLRSDCTRSR